MTPLWLIIHHTATDRDTTTFSSVKNYHISKGWGDIGYHWFITTSRAYQGRSEDVRGAHCIAGGMNFKSLGICLTGNFQVQQPMQWQLDRLEKLVRDLQAKYNIPNSNILGHREVDNASTVCCGDNLIPLVKKLRGGNMDSQIIKNSDAWIGILTYLEITKDSPTLDDAKNVVAGIKARANDMEKQKGQWEAKYNSAKDTISTLEAQLLEADKAEKACQTALNEAERNLKEARGQIAGMIEQRENLASDLAELKAKRSYDELLRIRRYFVAKYK